MGQLGQYLNTTPPPNAISLSYRRLLIAQLMAISVLRVAAQIPCHAYAYLWAGSMGRLPDPWRRELQANQDTPKIRIWFNHNDDGDLPFHCKRAIMPK